MAEKRDQRRLAAILVADVVGYSRLMEADEAYTLTALRERRKAILEPVVKEHGGRVVKVMGDGVLVEFASAVNSVKTALELQNLFSKANEGLQEDRRILLRIGINLGEVVGEGSDIYGDGINIAARLEGLAAPGGICISAKIYKEVRGKLSSTFEDMGERTLKNIERPVKVYMVRYDTRSETTPGLRPNLSLPDKPSIAVLPFQNMSGDSEQEYFADGMAEDIITALSRIRWLFVIARNSSFTYKGKAVDVKQVGRELGVRYVLEGSVRKASNRVRITGQLIDTATGAHLWADRFDGELADIFDLQDLVTSNVVGAIAPKLEQAEIERAKRKPTESLDAYDYFLRGMSAFHQFNKEANIEALEMFSKAIDLDAGFASASSMAARCYLQRRGFGWVVDRDLEIKEASRLARRGADLGREDAVALCAAGATLVVVVGELDDGLALIDRSLALNPNLAWGWQFSALANAYRGEPKIAIERAAIAMRLSPHDPQMFAMQTATALGYFLSNRYEEALSWSQAAVREQSKFLLSTCVVAASAALAGRVAESKTAMERLRNLNPHLRISNLQDLIPFRRSQDFESWAEGLRTAGLPE